MKNLIPVPIGRIYTDMDLLLIPGPRRIVRSNRKLLLPSIGLTLKLTLAKQTGVKLAIHNNIVKVTALNIQSPDYARALA